MNQTKGYQVRKLYFIVAIFLMLAPASLRADTTCGMPFCFGHLFTTPVPDDGNSGNNYPYFEDINDRKIISVGTTETTVQTFCAPLSGETGTVRSELRTPGSLSAYKKNFNVLLRAYIRIDKVIGVPAGGRYGVRFYVDGVEVGGATRFIRMQPTGTLPLLPQGDTFNASAQGLSPGNHRVELKAYVVPNDGGTMKIGLSWVTGQGVPVDYPAERRVNAAAATIGPLWTAITDELTVNNTSDQDIDIYPQAYFQFQGGTPGDQISLGFGLKKTTDANYPSSVHNSEIAVPCPLKDGSGNCYWPTGDPARDGVNISDNLFVYNGQGGPFPIAAHTSYKLVLFAINRSGRTATVAYRQIEYMSLPSSTSRAENYATDTVLVSNGNSSDQPVWGEHTTCGLWTRLLTVNVPASNGTLNWIGEGYIEFLGRGENDNHLNEGDWNAPDVEVLVEPTGQPVGTDFGQYIISLPRDRYGFYFHLDGAWWGNSGLGNTMTVWVRKRKGTSCAFTQCASRPSSGNATFRVGKRYLSAKTVPAANCYQYDISVSITGASRTNPIVITTSREHGFLTNDTVVISGVAGNTAANGTWTITKLSNTTFRLNTSIANGDYNGGGSVVPGGSGTCN